MNGFVKAAIAVTVALCPLQAASAVTFTQTFNNASAALTTLPKFDGALGVLTSVRFENRYATNYYFRFTDPFATEGPLVSVLGTIGSRDTGIALVNETIRSTRQPDGAASVSVTRSVDVTFNQGLSQYVGTGLLTVGSFADLAITFTDGTPVTPVVVSYPSPFTYAKVTYTFEQPVGGVPEPGTWALMLTGFALTGYALRRRRASVAFA